MHIRNAGLMLLVWGSCIVILDSLSSKIPEYIKRRYADSLSATDMLVEISNVWYLQ